MRIDIALQAVQRLYVETAPLIYYVEEHPTYISKMHRIIDLIETTPLAAFSSVLTLTEVMVQPLIKGDKHLAQEYRDILVNSGDYTLVAITTAVADSAAGLRARYNLRTPDALHVATAIQSSCDALLANDAGLKRVRELPVLVLDELEL